MNKKAGVLSYIVIALVVLIIAFSSFLPSMTGYSILPVAKGGVISSLLDFFGMYQGGGSLAINPNLTARITMDEPAIYSTSGYFPNLGMNVTRGFAPHAVFFEGWQSSPREELVGYQWDFGEGTESDPEGRYMDGFNAAHVYETPGNYTVTLRVMDSQGEYSDDETITVEVLSRTRTFYVDSQIGSDEYTGLCENVQGTCGPWKTANKAFMALVKSNGAPVSSWTLQPGDQVLFNKGQTFVLDRAIPAGHGAISQGVMFGSYGSGNKPLIQYNGTNGTIIFQAGNGLGYLTFEDLQFNFMYNSDPLRQATCFIFAPGMAKNILFLRDEFYDMENSIWMFHGDDKTLEPVNIFMVDSVASQPESAEWSTTIGGYGGPARLALINNSFDLSGNHINYLTGVNRA